MNRPSPTYSPDLEWWFRDSAAAMGETSSFGPSLERMRLFGRKAWTPNGNPRRTGDLDRDLSRRMAGEEDSIDQRDYFVDGNSIDPPPKARSADLKPAKQIVVVTARPRTLGRTESMAFEPDLRDVARARRVWKAWWRLSVEHRERLWFAYGGYLRHGSIAAHRAFRRAVACESENVIKDLAGYFSEIRRAA